MAQPQTCPKEASLQALIDGTLLQDEQGRISAHLESCVDCRQRLESLADQSRVISPEIVSAEAPIRCSGALEEVMRKLKSSMGGLEAVSAGSTIAPLSPRFLSPSENPRHLGRLGGYEILEVIGHGGMGTVLKARDSKLERLVAVKVLNPDLASSGPARRRFLQEARSAAAVTHEHVVTIHAVDDSGETPFMVMEYVVGASLEDVIQQNGQLRPEEILRIGMQSASGLAAAHAQGLVHRDIKPSNILLENSVARVKITDFGLVRVIHEAELTQTGTVAGTPQYMSPEQARGEPLDHRSDLFSLGCVMYAMCVGRSPFRAETPTGVIRRVCEDTPRPIREVNPEIPEWLVAIIDRLLAKKPEDRFQSAGEVAKLLERCLAHVQEPARVPLPIAAHDAAAIRRGVPGFHRRTSVIAAMFGCLALASIAGIALTETKWLRPASVYENSQAGGSLADQRRLGAMPSSNTIVPRESRDLLPENDVRPEDANATNANKRTLDTLLDQDIRARYTLANQYVLSRQWKLLAVELGRLVMEKPDSQGDYMALAVAQLMAGDIRGYKTTCADALRRLPNHKPYTKAFLVQLCCLSPDSAIDGHRIASLLKGLNPHTVSKSMFNQTMGFYLFRSGRDNEVLTMVFQGDDSIRGPCVLLLHAMASQRLGRSEDAKLFLEEAVPKIPGDFPSPQEPSDRDPTGHWVRWGILQILLRESQQMIAPEQVAKTAAPEAVSVLETGP